MDLYLVKTTEGSFIPAYNSDRDTANKIKPGRVVECKITKKRNYLFLKKFMALIRLGHHNTDLDMPFTPYRHYITMKAGFYDTYDTGKGTMFEAKSIAFGKMTEDEFEEVYSRVLDVILESVDSTSRDVEAELLEFM